MINVVHIGARGNPITEWNKIADKVNLYGIDASNDAIEELNKRTSKLNNASFYSYAITGTGGNRLFYETNDPACSSFLEPNKETWLGFDNPSRGFVKSSFELDTITLDDFENKHIKNGIDFLKMDVQGLEYEILNSYSHLDRLVGIEVEALFLPLYKDQPYFRDIANLLYKEGFSLYGMKRCSWRNGFYERVVFGDCLFINTNIVNENKWLILSKYGKPYFNMPNVKPLRKWDDGYTSF